MPTNARRIWFLTFSMIARVISARHHTVAFAAFRSRASRSLSIAATSFREGDRVDVNDQDGSILRGTVREVRGAGWYSIQMIGDGHAGSGAITQTRKFRGSQLQISPHEPEDKALQVIAIVEDDATDSNVQLPPPPPPTIYDLDDAILAGDPVQKLHDSLYLKQVAHHLSFTKWVTFTDLHCSPSTLDTCLAVLDYVHQVAVERNAGILFLGDWWHHRGTIRVDILNAVLASLKSWTQPMVMIPGNHDQVTLGGHNHGLTPLQNAYQCSDTQIPGPLIFSHPTIFGRALFIPHLRDNAIMESVLQSSASQHATAIFCHADVMGAKMNDLIVSQGGVLPQYFPPRIPIYSGHFHKPHVVSMTKSQKNVDIEYVGSPYETTMAEAHQEKHILVLDSTQGWKTIESLPVNLGRKHFKADSVEELLMQQSSVRAGDRVVVTVSSEELEDLRRRHQDELGESKLDATVSRLRKAGAAVEIREVKAIPSRAIGPGVFDKDTRQLEELTPAVTLASYFDEEVNRSSMTNLTARELFKAGMELLEEVEASDESPSTNVLTDIKLCSVSLEGFGPFKDRVTYPLLDRGLVLLRGTNKDGGSDSNGTGKSSLAMATLWGLTGSIDPRLVSDAKVADVVTDGCKTTKVVIQGTLNGEDFRIIRTKTASKTGLVFFLGDKDLTTQSFKETQELMEERLGVSLQVLSRTVFHGQHLINGLLEATDVKFKDELALVVPVDLWQRAATLVRAKARNSTKTVTELGGMTKLREKDLMALQVQRDDALKKRDIRQLAFEEKRLTAQEKFNRLAESSVEYDTASIEVEIASLNTEITKLQGEVQACKQDRDEKVQRVGGVFDIQSRLALEAKSVVQQIQRDLDLASLKFEIAKSSLKFIEEKWQIDLSPGMTPVLHVQKCPTCFQSISEDSSGHAHDEIRKAFLNETEVAMVDLNHAEKAKKKATMDLSEATSILETSETNLNKARDDVVRSNAEFSTKIAKLEALLEDARARHSSFSSQMSEAFSNMKNNAEFQKIKTALEAEEWLLRSSEERSNQLQQDCARVEENLKDMISQADAQRSAALTLSSLSDSFGTKGIQNYVQQNAIEALQMISQAYLDELSDGSLRLSLCLDAGDRIDRRAFVRLPDGDFAERPLSSLSGGQWRRCSLALTFGFLDLISRRGRLRPSLLVMDEPLTHLDRSGRSRVGSLLRKLLVRGEDIGGLGSSGICAGTIILILQDLAAEELEEAFDHIDEVVKCDGFSSVSIDERSS